MVAAGATTTATAADTRPDGRGATHFSVEDEDGIRRVIPLGMLRNGLDSLDVDPSDTCFAPCCSNCFCRHCLCGNC